MFDASITLGQLIGFFLAIVGAMLGFWVRVNIRLTALELSKRYYEKEVSELKNDYQNISQKLDELNKGQNEIKILLQDKQDRPKN